MLFFPFWTLKFQSTACSTLWYTKRWQNIRPKTGEIVNCSLCTFHPGSNSELSTSRDVILASAFTKFSGVIPFVRSFRSTKSMAQLFIFCDSSVFKSLSASQIDILDNCHCNIVDIGTIPNLKRLKSLSLRYVVYYDFLFTRQSLFDRIISIDLFDITFQDDPFVPLITNETLWLLPTTGDIEHNQNAVQWIAELEGTFEQAIFAQKPLLTPSFIAGGITLFLPFLRTIVQSSFPDKEPRFPDIAHLNRLYYRGLIEGAQVWNISLVSYIDVQSLGPDDSVTIGEAGPKGFPRPAILHRYNKVPASAASVVQQCPPPSPRPPEYIDGMSEAEIDGLVTSE